MEFAFQVYIKDLRKISPLTVEEEKRLFKKFRRVILRQKIYCDSSSSSGYKDCGPVCLLWRIST